VELGASHIVPFESSRCIKRPKADKAEEKTARLMRIAEEAAKQCGRGILPRVSVPVSFEQAVALSKESELSLFCYEGEGTESLKSILQENKTVKSIAVFVGSEGGFSPDEAAYALSQKLRLTNLGPRILRCETAPDYVLSSISYEFEF
jgi:16S rRNA (uracil1498-N3)-methyltransferase